MGPYESMRKIMSESRYTGTRSPFGGHSFSVLLMRDGTEELEDGSRRIEVSLGIIDAQDRCRTVAERRTKPRKYIAIGVSTCIQVLEKSRSYAALVSRSRNAHKPIAWFRFLPKMVFWACFAHIQRFTANK